MSPNAPKRLFDAVLLTFIVIIIGSVAWQAVDEHRKCTGAGGIYVLGKCLDATEKEGWRR